MVVAEFARKNRSKRVRSHSVRLPLGLVETEAGEKKKEDKKEQFIDVAVELVGREVESQQEHAI